MPKRLNSIMPARRTRAGQRGPCGLPLLPPQRILDPRPPLLSPPAAHTPMIDFLSWSHAAVLSPSQCPDQRPEEGKVERVMTTPRCPVTSCTALLGGEQEGESENGHGALSQRVASAWSIRRQWGSLSRQRAASLKASAILKYC